jgi:starvation-inducible DNA-binding protein
MKRTKSYASPSRLPEKSRAKIAAALDAILADGLDLHGQIKTAHWNVKGPHFAALHPLFETFAVSLAGFDDEIAERAVTLGGLVHGTAKHVAASSRITPYPEESTRDLELVGVLAERFEGYVEHVKAARDVAEAEGDVDTVDLLTTAITAFEKHAWFLRATLERS